VKVGDLVKMKYVMWWQLQDRKDFVHEPALVVAEDFNCVILLFSTGKTRRDLAEHWEAINENS
jgi:hypothetical protein